MLQIQESIAVTNAETVFSIRFQWDILVEPFFKRDYRSHELFFELTDERKTDRELFSRYAQYLLGKMAKTY